MDAVALTAGPVVSTQRPCSPASSGTCSPSLRYSEDHAPHRGPNHIEQCGSVHIRAVTKANILLQQPVDWQHAASVHSTSQPLDCSRPRWSAALTPGSLSSGQQDRPEQCPDGQMMDFPLHGGAICAPSFYKSFGIQLPPLSISNRAECALCRSWKATSGLLPSAMLASNHSVSNDANTPRCRCTCVSAQISLTNEATHDIWYSWPHKITWPDLQELMNIRFELHFQPSDGLGGLDVARLDSIASSYADTYPGQPHITTRIKIRPQFRVLQELGRYARMASLTQ